MQEASGVTRGLKEQLRAHGFHPSRLRGQNFLLDENILKAIVRDAEVEPGARVFEVGCGPGTLTACLLAAGAEVLSAEIEPRLLAIARERLPPDQPWRVIEGDVLASKSKLAPAIEQALDAWGPYDLVANLPYAITTSLLVLLASRTHAPRRMTVLVQREAAERLSAPPGTKLFGAATVRLGARYHATRLRDVPPQVFWPRPSVDSAVVRLDRRTAGLDAATAEALEALLTRAFTMRRKRFVRTVEDLAPANFWQALAAESSWPDGLRPEQIPVEEWVAIAQRLAANQGH